MVGDDGIVEGGQVKDKDKELHDLRAQVLSLTTELWHARNALVDAARALDAHGTEHTLEEPVMRIDRLFGRRPT